MVSLEIIVCLNALPVRNFGGGEDLYQPIGMMEASLKKVFL